MSRHPVDLTYQTALDLLRRNELGRVAVCTPSGPRIFPVNYSVHRDSLVFRTAPYTVLGTYADGSLLALEIDGLDHEQRTGWSVVATGRASVIDEPAEIDAIRAEADPSPWASGQRLLYVRLRWEELTGRRIGEVALTDPEPRATTAS
jgi:nitroimidazol reductase NimA-like FMN-containing flavoprotein (pyridoxamine 5'-phosphate oxidase superfamily)